MPPESREMHAAHAGGPSLTVRTGFSQLADRGCGAVRRAFPRPGTRGIRFPKLQDVVESLKQLAAVVSR